MEFNISVDAGADLSGNASQYKAVAIGGTIAATNTGALGLLQNKPKSGEDAAVLVMGRSKYVAGAAVTIGARLIVTTSGYCIAAGSNQLAVGIAEFAASSGETARGIFNFIGAKTSVVSAHLT